MGRDSALASSSGKRSRITPRTRSSTAVSERRVSACAASASISSSLLALMIDLTAGMRRGDMERLRSPSPRSTQVKAGSPAMSPQMEMGLRAPLAPSMALLSRRRMAVESAELRPENVRSAEREPHGPHAEARVRAPRHRHRQGQLLSSDVERPEGRCPTAESGQHRHRILELLLLAGKLGAVEIQELRPEQAD